MRKLFGMLVIGSVAWLASATASAQSGYRDDARWGDSGRTVRCESYGKQPQECPINTRGGVRLVRKLSERDCVQGRDWGTRRNYVWVSNGCRAEFAVDRGGGGGDWGNGNGRTVRCESYGKQPKECPINTRGGVQLVRKLSDRDCVQGRDWGYRRDYVWVSNGCRAEFATGGGGWGGGDPGWGGGGGTRTVRCQSYDKRPQECAADTRNGVRLVRKLSDRDCIEGRDWGYRRDYVWVSNGCRAEFETGSGWWR